MESTVDFPKLIPVFQRYAQIDAVYLFGTVAAETAYRFSDIDLDRRDLNRNSISSYTDLRKCKSLSLVSPVNRTDISANIIE